MKKLLRKTQKALTRTIASFSKLKLQSKIVIASILFFLFGSGFGASLLIQRYLSLRFQNMLKKEEEASPTKTANISLETDNAKPVRNGEDFNVYLRLDSPDQGVEAGSFRIIYDPEILTAKSVTEGNYFKVFPKNEITQGSVNLWGVAEISEEKIVIPKGKGIVATIIFSPLKASLQTAISFDRDKTIVASAGENILGEAKNLTINNIE